MPLYGNEISKEITPLEGGLKFAVKLDKEEDFIGKEALNKQWKEGLTRKVAGFELLERGIPREGYEVYKEGKKNWSCNNRIYVTNFKEEYRKCFNRYQ